MDVASHITPVGLRISTLADDSSTRDPWGMDYGASHPDAANHRAAILSMNSLWVANSESFL